MNQLTMNLSQLTQNIWISNVIWPISVNCWFWCLNIFLLRNYTKYQVFSLKLYYIPGFWNPGISYNLFQKSGISYNLFLFNCIVYQVVYVRSKLQIRHLTQKQIVRSTRFSSGTRHCYPLRWRHLRLLVKWALLRSYSSRFAPQQNRKNNAIY